MTRKGYRGIVKGVVLFSGMLFSHFELEAGPKGVGMGNIGTVYPIDDSTVGLYNPAVMAVVEDRIDLSAGVYNHSGHTKVYGNQFPQFPGGPKFNGDWNAVHTKNWPLAFFGINKHYCINICNKTYDVALGIVGGPYNPVFKTTYKKPFPLKGTSDFGAEVVQYIGGPTLAINLNKCLAVGISWNFAAERLKINGFENLAEPHRSIHPNHVTNKGYDWGLGTGFSIGFRSQLTNWLAFGAKWQSKTYMTRMHKYEGLVCPYGKLDLPWSASAGFALKPCCNSTFIVDVEFYRNKSVHQLRNSLTPSNPLSLAGTINGPGKGYMNVWRYHVGADYCCGNITYRAGYIYHKSPIRRSQTLGNNDTLDLLEHRLTLGATWQCNCKWDFTFFYVHGFPNEVKGHHSIPLQFYGGECDIRARDDIFVLGLGMKF